MSTERELFEAWAVTESFNIDRHYDDAGGEYHRVTTRWAWMAWQAARSADTSGALHVAVCQAVALLNRAPEVARCTEGREARDILRQALVDYADTYMDQPAPETERAAVARKHQKSTRRPPPAAPGGPAGARRQDENSPSGPSDRALNPQPEAVDRDRGAR